MVAKKFMVKPSWLPFISSHCERLVREGCRGLGGYVGACSAAHTLCRLVCGNVNK